MDLRDEEVQALNRAVLVRCGIDFTNYELGSLKRQIIRFMYRHKLAHTVELWMKILREPAFVNQYVSGISVGLTGMFRNPGLWESLRCRLLPRFSGKHPLKIWLAGCATGEEAATLAIVLHEAGLLQQADILATDMNPQAVEAARQGSFRLDDTKSYAEAYLKHGGNAHLTDYFDCHGQTATLKQALSLPLRFGIHNLVSDPFPAPFDLIFCRNVMIYFDTYLKTKTAAAFHGSLAKGGLLVLGHYDNLPSAGLAYFDPVFGEPNVFIKRDTASPPGPLEAWRQSVTPRP